MVVSIIIYTFRCLKFKASLENEIVSLFLKVKEVRRIITAISYVREKQFCKIYLRYFLKE
jgi:hypothetical protein